MLLEESGRHLEISARSPVTNALPWERLGMSEYLTHQAWIAGLAVPAGGNALSLKHC